MRFEAAIHGIDLDKTTKGSDVPQTQGKQMAGFKFGKPEDYEHMSKEEREKLTQKMMGQHKAWNAIQKPMGGKQGKIYEE